MGVTSPFVIANHQEAKKPGKKDQGWSVPTRAKRASGGGVLTPKFHSLSGGGDGVMAPAASFFSPDVQAQLRSKRGAKGAAKYDPVMLRGLGSGAFGGSGVMRFTMSLNDREQTERPYEENFVVRSALRAFANGMVSMPFELWSGSPKEQGSEMIEEHPLLDLLDKPNRSQSGSEQVYAHTIDYKHDGDVFWFLMNESGEPVNVNDSNGLITEFPKQMLSVRGERVQHKCDAAGFPTEYRYGIGDGGWSKPFPWVSVIQFMEYDPYNFIRGLGDVRALTREIDLMFQSYRYLDAAVKNGGDPGGFIVFDESIGQDELDARQADVDDTYTADNAGRYKVLDRKAKFTPNPTTPKDMEYQSLFDWTLKAICAGIGTPPPVIGWYEEATYNNVDAARREMWSGSNGILSHAAGRQGTIRTKLIPRLEGTPEMRGQAGEIYPFWNPSGIEVLKKDRTDQIVKAAEAAAKGVGVSFNEALAMAELDVEPAEHGDTAYISNNLREHGEPSSAAVSMATAKKTPSQKSERAESDGRTWVAMPTRALAEDADPLLQKRAKQWLDRYGKAIVSRLSVFANGGRRPASRAYTASDKATVRVDLSKLTKKDLEFMVLNEVQWAKSLEKTTSVPIKGIWKEGLAAAREIVGGPIVPITDPKIVKAISEQVTQLAGDVTGATSNKVRSAILRILTQDSGNKSLRQAIKDNLPALSKELRRVFGSNDARALTIAVTETNAGTQRASFTQMGEAGVATKRWKTRSSDPRDSHRDAAAAGEIAFDASFPNGGKFPHDPSLPASEVVNCICTLEAETFEDDLNP